MFNFTIFQDRKKGIKKIDMLLVRGKIQTYFRHIVPILRTDIKKKKLESVTSAHHI